MEIDLQFACDVIYYLFLLGDVKYSGPLMCNSCNTIYVIEFIFGISLSIIFFWITNYIIEI